MEQKEREIYRKQWEAQIFINDVSFKFQFPTIQLSGIREMEAGWQETRS